MPLSDPHPDRPRPLRVPPKIYHVHANALDGIRNWGAVCEHARTLGFDHLAVAGLFASGPASHPLLLEDPHASVAGSASPDHGALAMLFELCRRCESVGLVLILDMRADRARAIPASLRANSPVVQWTTEPEHGIDPRSAALSAPGHALAWNKPENEAPLVRAWIALLTELLKAGVKGFRWLEPASIPATAIATIINGVRALDADVLFIGWTVGAPRGVIANQQGVGWGLVVSSFPWWDFRADWFFEECDQLSALGPVMHPVADPFATCRSQVRMGSDPRAASRALWSAAALGVGTFVPMGFEFGLMPGALIGNPAGFAAWVQSGKKDGAQQGGVAPGGPKAAAYDLTAEVKRLHAWLDTDTATSDGRPARVSTVTGPNSALTVVARGSARAETLLVGINPEPRETMLPVHRIVRALRDGSGRLARVEPGSPDGSARVLTPLSELHLDSFGVCLMRPLPPSAVLEIPSGPRAARTALEAALDAPRIAIEAVEPQVDQGRFAVRRTVGEIVTVEADVWIDGHIEVEVALRWRAVDTKAWFEARMLPLGNDRWRASFPLDRLGRHEFSIEAWVDEYANWASDVEKKRVTEQVLDLEVAEGAHLLRNALARTPSPALRRIALRLAAIEGDRFQASWHEALVLLLDRATCAAMGTAGQRAFLVRTANAFPVESERLAARFSAWYELFPRSLGQPPGTHGRLTDVIARLPAIRAMGFDVLYMPPIHPIGRAHRKGRNNATQAAPDDPGSPYAIGSAEGGHTAVHPQLGTLEDVRALVAAAGREGLELALDFAVQCSPDHPWLKDHPEWFQFRADGSVRYAENPPKKYQDIVNVDFYSSRNGARDNSPALALWQALRDVILFWAEQGIRIFRVDNPHTKPLPFWEWMIGSVRATHPDIIFLAEAFTRPKMMARLAKVGFSQSYTYFTWRNEKPELTAYLNELTQTGLAQYFRPHFFVNTPDINPWFLQTSGRPGFLIRAALAAFLSGLWGVYSGFELCESLALPGREEYADSEKYELRPRDWNAPGNITAEITRLNAIRRANTALHDHLNIRFHGAGNDRILYFGRQTPERDNVVLVAITLDPHHAQEADIEIPLWEFGLGDDGSLSVHDLYDGNQFVWTGKIQHIRLDPHQRPFMVWRIQHVS